MKKVFSLMLLLATIVIALPSCSDDDEPNAPQLTQFDYTLYAGETTNVKGESLSNLEWVGDKFVANIDKDGILHANKIGYTRIHSTDITAGDYTGIRVVVKPQITRYSEPLLYWQGGQAHYKEGYIQLDPGSYSNMPTADIWELTAPFIPLQIKECALPWTVHKQDATTIIFKTDKNASPYVAYLFDNDRKVTGVGVYIDPLQGGELPDFLNERYLIYDVDVSNYTANFAHAVGYRDEPKIDYVGQMGYSSSLGLILIVYAPVNNARGEDYPIFDTLSEIEL